MSSGVLKVVITAVSLITVTAIAAIYTAIAWSVDISRVGRLEARNETLQVELIEMQGAIAALADTMHVMTQRDREVRLLAGLTPHDADVQQAGVGGPRGELTPTVRLLEETPLGRQAISMNEDVATLIRRAHLLAGSFSEAVDSMAKRQSSLQRTPSIMPTAGYLSSGFSHSRLHPVYNVARPHLGIDVVAEKGTPILAPAAGRVVGVGRQSGYGKIVTIDHGNGVRTRYAHCDEILVKLNQRVERGEEIARVGDTGVTTNFHLHYEVLVNGRHVDPRNYIFGEIIVD